MSFVKKAVKKVFKAVKKLWDNKWVRIAVGVGVALFVGGLASAGEGSISAGWGVFKESFNDVGSFFSSVGKTIAEGFDYYVTGIKNFFTGDAPKSGTPSAPANSGGYGFSGAGVGFGGTRSGVGESVTGELVKVGAEETIKEEAEKGILGKVLSGIGNLFKGTTGDNEFSRTLLWAGLNGAFQAWGANEQAKEEKKFYYERLSNMTVWGGSAYGGGPTEISATRDPFAGLGPRPPSVGPGQREGSDEPGQAFAYADRPEITNISNITNVTEDARRGLLEQEGYV